MWLSQLLALIIIAPLTLGACTTYKPRDQDLSKLGFEEHVLEDGSLQLDYYGASHQDRDQIETLWHQRANELCAGNEYEANPPGKRMDLRLLHRLAAPAIQTRGLSPQHAWPAELPELRHKKTPLPKQWGF